MSVEGRRRLVARCWSRPIAHVAAEMSISRQCASKWVNRWRRFDEACLLEEARVNREKELAAMLKDGTADRGRLGDIVHARYLYWELGDRQLSALQPLRAPALQP